MELDSYSMLGISMMLEEAGHEIETDYDQVHVKWEASEKRIETLEGVLKIFISYLEDHGDKPDLKTMAANLRRQIGN